MTTPKSVERGIPIPLKGNQVHKTDSRANLLRSMEVGDSVLCADEGEAAKWRVIAGQVKVKMTQRRVEDGIRIWRVA